MHQLIGIGLCYAIAIQQTLQGAVNLESFQLKSRFDALTGQPIVATSTAEKQGAQDDTDEHPNAVAQKPLTKIHDSKVKQ